VFIPFEAGGETEQTLRANTLANLNGVVVVRSDALNAETLLRAVKRCLNAQKRSPMQQSMDGAAETTRVLQRLLEARR
ncbi:MAG: glycosyltransferase, partial [Roseobacter sp.]|nr:glycosyltransferase [Roseobacter sp.]